jgi:hypothetical protein
MVSFLLMYTLKPLADEELFIDCVEASGAGDKATACYGTSAVLRMTFSLFIFHIVMTLILLPRGTCSAIAHDSGWCIKVSLIFALFTGMFWIDISFFKIWGEVSRYVSILFFLIMAFYILDGSYNFNSVMVSKIEQ